MDAVQWAPWITAAITVAAFFIARRSDVHDDGANGQYVRDKLDLISSNVSETRTDVRELKRELENHEGRITRLEVEVSHLQRDGDA